MKKILQFVILFVFALTCSVGAQTKKTASSESYVAFEVNSGRVLYSMNANAERPISSLVQVVTALVALDWIKRAQIELNQVIIVPESVEDTSISNPMKLRQGDSLTLRDALYSILLGSDNASSMAVADFVGSNLLRRRGKGGDPIAEFVSEMNLLAEALGMTKTKFRSPNGLDGKKVNTSTAADLALLGYYAMLNEAFAFIVSQNNRSIGVQTREGIMTYKITNTNPLLSDPGVDGIKTGKSNPAGACAMISVKRDSIKKVDPATRRESLYPQRMVVVVLGSEDRYVLTRELIREGWKEFDSWLNRGFPRIENERRTLMLKK